MVEMSWVEVGARFSNTLLIRLNCTNINKAVWYVATRAVSRVNFRPVEQYEMSA